MNSTTALKPFTATVVLNGQGGLIALPRRVIVQAVSVLEAYIGMMKIVVIGIGCGVLCPMAATVEIQRSNIVVGAICITELLCIYQQTGPLSCIATVESVSMYRECSFLTISLNGMMKIVTIRIDAMAVTQMQLVGEIRSYTFATTRGGEDQEKNLTFNIISVAERVAI